MSNITFVPHVIDRGTDPELIKFLMRHCYQKDSMMQDRTFELHAEKWRMWPRAARDGLAYLMFVGDKFVGWTLTFKMEDEFGKERRCLYIWIVTRHRRKGYGRLLMDATKKMHGVRGNEEFFVEPHDRPSFLFFEETN